MGNIGDIVRQPTAMEHKGSEQIDSYNHGNDIFTSAFVLITKDDTKVITTYKPIVSDTHPNHNAVRIVLSTQYGPPRENSTIYGRTPGGLIYTLYVVVFRRLT